MPFSLKKVPPGNRPGTSLFTIEYRKFPKYSDTQKICCNHSKLWTIWLYHRVMSPNDADGIANSVCTVCPGISVRNLRNITAMCSKDADGITQNDLGLHCLLRPACNRCIIFNYIWTASWQNQQNDCAPSEDSDQPENPPSLIRVFSVHMKKPGVLNYPKSEQRRLWSDWADAQADLSLRWVHRSVCCFCHQVAHVMVLSRGGSFTCNWLTFTSNGRRVFETFPTHITKFSFKLPRLWPAVGNRVLKGKLDHVYFMHSIYYQIIA